jgi:phage regulator Rha-like protein
MKLKKIQEYTSRDISEWTGKRHADVMKDIRNETKKLGELAKGIFTLGYYADKNNQQRPMFILNKYGVLQIAARYDAVVRFLIIQKLKEFENPKLPKTYKEALQALIKSEEEKEDAIRTKAWISDKKTATAMNTASQLSKENAKLKEKLDINISNKFMEYSTTNYYKETRDFLKKLSKKEYKKLMNDIGFICDKRR